MNENPPPLDDLQDLLDDYLSGLLDEERTGRLEQMLLADPTARDRFVRYCRMHTDLHLHVRANAAGRRALERIGADAPAGEQPQSVRIARSWRRMAVAALAACLLVASGLGIWRMQRRDGAQGQSIAWLVNAQNCQWSEDAGPTGKLQPGRVLSLSRGLVEVRFAGGASIVLEGPARLELLSAHSARLLKGKLAATVPEPARGFQVFSPQGKVVDLGTEFGMAIADDGSTHVHVFTGQVEAYAGGSTKLGLQERQSAQIAGGAVALRPAHGDQAAGVVRSIAPIVVTIPRTLVVDFRRPVPGSLLDGAGRGTGLTHRLPGTGAELPVHDPGLKLNTEAGSLEMTTTRSDINTQLLLAHGEYPGVRLADLGFTGGEDFEISATVPNIPSLHAVGQFGLYVGPRSNRNIRGGLISRDEPERYGQFLVNNDNGRDKDLNVVGLLSSGDDLHLTLRRHGGRYSMGVENRSTGGSSTVSIRHPDFLDAEKDLYAGFFAASPQSDAPRTLLLKEIRVTVWTPK